MVFIADFPSDRQQLRSIELPVGLGVCDGVFTKNSSGVGPTADSPDQLSGFDNVAADHDQLSGFGHLAADHDQLSCFDNVAANHDRSAEWLVA